MSDPMIEEDGLISQDDIDKLMGSFSIEEAEDKPANDDDLVDELGELSQDDIDSLMNSNLSDPEDSPDKPDAAEMEDGEMELISQDDIDQLMNSNSASEETTLPALGDDEEFEELSQDDIKALMGAQDSKDEKEKKQDDFVINESEAAGVSDCLISQATLDGLIENFNTTPDLVILDVDPPAPADKSPEPGAFKIPPDISDDDTEGFLKPQSDADVLELKDDKGDVTQEDIDALLSEPDDEEETEDDVLISQDDIDTLLMAADQEDEDVPGDLMDKGVDIGLDEDLPEKGAPDEIEEEEDDNEIEDEEEDGGNEDQVVLQGEDEVATKPKKKNKKAGSHRIKKKLVLAFASFLVILGITVPITYFLFFSGGQKVQELVSAPPKPVVNIQREVEIESSDTPLKQPVEDKNQGNMVLKDFVILAPDISKNMTYVTAEISIDYADQKVFKEIQNNLSYYRDLIYDAIGKGLVAEKQENITEAEILSRIETTLKKALPGNSIGRVGFISFKIS
jgi:pilus assembly protein FimV